MTPFLAWVPGWQELLLILVVVLIFFGPRKLPEVADALGKSIRKFKSASRDATDAVQKELDDARQAAEGEPEKPKKDESKANQDS